MSYFPSKSYVFIFFFLSFFLFFFVSWILDCEAEFPIVISPTHTRNSIQTAICSYPLLLTNWLTSVEMFSQRNKGSLSCRGAPERLDKKNRVDNICWNLYAKRIMWRRAKVLSQLNLLLQSKVPWIVTVHSSLAQCSPLFLSPVCVAPKSTHHCHLVRAFELKDTNIVTSYQKLVIFVFSLVLLLFSDVLIVLVYKHALQSTSQKRKPPPKKRQKWKLNINHKTFTDSNIKKVKRL